MALAAIADTTPALLVAKEVLERFFNQKDLNGWDLSALAEGLMLDSGIKATGARVRQSSNRHNPLRVDDLPNDHEVAVGL